MKIISLMILLFTLNCLAQVHAELDAAPERIFWDKVPLPITLPVGSERLVTFPDNVRLRITAALQMKLRTQSHQGTVYWLAHEPFETTRIQVQGIDSGQVFLVDLKAIQDQTPLPPVEIQIKKQVIEREQAANSLRLAPLDYVHLTRFAAQQLYAPARLLKTPPGVTRSGVKQLPLTHLIRGLAIEATPIAAWRKGPLYITAIQLKNQSHLPVILDPRAVRGQWKTATFQHARLHAAGSTLDTTALYLISSRPFSEIF